MLLALIMITDAKHKLIVRTMYGNTVTTTTCLSFVSGEGIPLCRSIFNRLMDWIKKSTRKNNEQQTRAQSERERERDTIEQRRSHCFSLDAGSWPCSHDILCRHRQQPCGLCLGCVPVDGGNPPPPI